MGDQSGRLAWLHTRASWNRRTAVRVTVLAAFAVLVSIGLQVVVTAAVTSADQPVASVGEVPAQPQANNWEDAPSRTVELHEQQMAVPHGGGSTDEVQVKALTNESHVAFRLTWTDPTRDEDIGAPNNYSDAAAVMFANGEMPPITMGAVSDPVNIWYWRASWQANGSAYGTGDMYSYNHDRAGTDPKPATAVDNPLSRARYEQYAQNYYAKGFGSTSYAPSQPVRADATRTEDGWAVTFVRERTTDGEFDAAFGPDRTVYMAMAVWNGSAEEVNGQKSITLQFTTLDTEDGQLAGADTGDGSSQSSGGESRTGAESGDGTARGPVDLLFVLAVGVVLIWMGALFGEWRRSS